MLDRGYWRLTILAIACLAARGWADDMAYMLAGPSDFGEIDLNTGVYTDAGPTGVELGGIGDIGDGHVYGMSFHGTGLYTIDTTTGAATLVGNGSNSLQLGGSTLTTLYALGDDFNLYSINPSTGASTEIGTTGLGSASWYGMSTGSSTLYISDGTNLYTVDTTTGAATLDKSLGSLQLGAIVLENGTLYGGVDDPNNNVINIGNNDSTVSSLSGTPNNFWGLAAADAVTKAVPLPASALSGVVLLGALGIKRRRDSL